MPPKTERPEIVIPQVFPDSPLILGALALSNQQDVGIEFVTPTINQPSPIRKLVNRLLIFGNELSTLRSEVPIRQQYRDSHPVK